MTFYNPFGGVPTKACGCATYVWCTHVQLPTWPNTTTIAYPATWAGDDGYVGKHRKPGT